MTRDWILFGFLTVTFASRAGGFADRELWMRGKAGLPDSLAQRYGAEVVWSSELVPGLRRIRIQRAKDRSELLRALAKLPGVRYAEPNYFVHRDLRAPSENEQVPAVPDWPTLFGVRPFGRFYSDSATDPLEYLQWALTSPVGLHPEEAWHLTRGTHKVRVAVIDTGAVAQHPDLAPNIVGGYDVIDHTSNLSDDGGHGTHVAGIIGAVSDNGIGISGVAGNIALIPVRAVPVAGDESDANVIEAIEYAVKAGARLINLSFGKPEASQAVAEAILAAGERGVTVIAAAGNRSADLNGYRHYPASFRTPNMIVVASLDTDGALAAKSNYGSGRVDLAAPGERILSTWTNASYAYSSGTSMATPQVTGVAALMLSVDPRLGPARLRELLLESVDRAPELEGRVTSGGRINASKAVQASLLAR